MDWNTVWKKAAYIIPIKSGETAVYISSLYRGKYRITCRYSQNIAGTAGAGLVDPRKRICGYCSLAGYRVFLPRFHIPESGIPEIRRVGHPVLDCHYNVPDRSSVLCHQPAETSGNDDHALFCRYDRFVTGILYSDQ